MTANEVSESLHIKLHFVFRSHFYRGVCCTLRDQYQEGDDKDETLAVN